MKLYWRLLKLDWLDLWGIFCGCATVAFFIFFTYQEKISWNSAHFLFDQTQILVVLIFSHQLTNLFVPWLPRFGTKGAHPLFPDREWTQILPISAKKQYHLCCLKFFLSIVVCVGLLFWKVGEHPNTIISLAHYSPETSQKEISTLKAYFPNTQITEKMTDNKKRTVAILPSGNYWSRFIIIIPVYVGLLIMINLIYYFISRAKLLKRIRTINFWIGMSPMAILFASVLTTIEINCQILVFFQKNVFLILTLLFSLTIASYIHGLKRYQYREIE